MITAYSSRASNAVRLRVLISEKSRYQVVCSPCCMRIAFARTSSMHQQQPVSKLTHVPHVVKATMTRRMKDPPRRKERRNPRGRVDSLSWTQRTTLSRTCTTHHMLSCPRWHSRMIMVPPLCVKQRCVCECWWLCCSIVALLTNTHTHTHTPQPVTRSRQVRHWSSNGRL